MTTPNPFFPVQTPSAPQPTQAQLLAAAQNHMSLDGRQLLAQMVSVIQRNWSAVWANPNFTPAQYVAQLGTSAAEVFRCAGLLVGCIAAINPTLLDPKYLSAAKAYTVHPDGTVTLNSSSGS